MTTVVYIAAPLCSEAERSFNLRLNEFVKGKGCATYLPQVDGGLLSDLVRSGSDETLARRAIFQKDCDAVRRAHICLTVLDGRAIDEGVCFELGMAFTLGIRCIGFKTDSRSAVRGHDNLMIEESLSAIARSWAELSDLLTAHSVP
jgi:nucleoside 2-deoxyribosyltransferase